MGVVFFVRLDIQIQICQTKRQIKKMSLSHFQDPNLKNKQTNDMLALTGLTK